MMKQYSLLLALGIFFISNGMEIVPSTGLYCLALLLDDVQNQIAHSLVFNDSESDEEFIERSKWSNNIAPEHRELLNKKEKQKLSSAEIQYNNKWKDLGFHLP